MISRGVFFETPLFGNLLPDFVPLTLNPIANPANMCKIKSVKTNMFENDEET